MSRRSIGNHSAYIGFPDRQPGGGWIKSQIEEHARLSWDNPTNDKDAVSEAGNEQAKRVETPGFCPFSMADGCSLGKDKGTPAPKRAKAKGTRRRK